GAAKAGEVERDGVACRAATDPEVRHGAIRTQECSAAAHATIRRDREGDRVWRHLVGRTLGLHAAQAATAGDLDRDDQQRINTAAVVPFRRRHPAGVGSIGCDRRGGRCRGGPGARLLLGLASRFLLGLAPRFLLGLLALLVRLLLLLVEARYCGHGLAQQRLLLRCIDDSARRQALRLLPGRDDLAAA